MGFKAVLGDVMDVDSMGKQRIKSVKYSNSESMYLKEQAKGYLVAQNEAKSAREEANKYKQYNNFYTDLNNEYSKLKGQFISLNSDYKSLKKEHTKVTKELNKLNETLNRNSELKRIFKQEYEKTHIRKTPKNNSRDYSR